MTKKESEAIQLLATVLVSLYMRGGSVSDAVYKAAYHIYVKYDTEYTDAHCLEVLKRFTSEL